MENEKLQQSEKPADLILKLQEYFGREDISTERISPVLINAAVGAIKEDQRQKTIGEIKSVLEEAIKLKGQLDAAITAVATAQKEVEKVRKEVGKQLGKIFARIEGRAATTGE